MTFHFDVINNGIDEHKIIYANDIADAKRTASRRVKEKSYEKVRVYEALDEWGEATRPIWLKVSGGEWEEL